MEFQEWNGGVRKVKQGANKQIKKARKEFWSNTKQNYKDYWNKEKQIAKDVRNMSIKDRLKNTKNRKKIESQNSIDFWKKTGDEYKKYYGKTKDIRKNEKKQLRKIRRKKILSDPTKLYRHRDEFSDDEIRKAMKTFHRDEDLRNLSSNKKKSKLDTPKRILAYGGTAIAAYEMIKKRKKNSRWNYAK